MNELNTYNVFNDTISPYVFDLSTFPLIFIMSDSPKSTIYIYIYIYQCISVHLYIYCCVLVSERL